MRPRIRRDRGSALVIVVVLASITLLVCMTTLTESVASTRYVGQSARGERLRYAAEAAIAYYRDQITYPQNATPAYSPAYVGNTNQWLFNQRGPATDTWTPLFTKPAPTMTIGVGGREPPIPVWVWLNDVNSAGNDFRLAVYAEYPQNRRTPAPGASNERILLIHELRESQPFSSYMFFTFNQPLRLGNITVSGSVHTNGRLEYPASGRAVISGNATASGGVLNSGNGLVGGSKNYAAPRVALPAGGVSGTDTVAAASNRPGDPASAKFYSIKDQAGGYWTGQGLRGPLTVDVVINNGPTPTLDITARDSRGRTSTVNGVPYPDKGVIYADGNVSVSAPNGFSGKLTLVSGNGDVIVKTNLEYKDMNPGTPPEGQKGYQLVDPSTGSILDPATTPGSFSSYRYESNPNYSGAATLGLMARNNVSVDPGAPSNLIFNGSAYAERGSPLKADTAGAKNNLLVGGSLVGTNTVAASNGIQGYLNGRLYAFDVNGAKNPPPAWLSTPAPVFGAIYRRSPNAVPASYLRDPRNASGGGSGL